VLEDMKGVVSAIETLKSAKVDSDSRLSALEEQNQRLQGALREMVEIGEKTIDPPVIVPPLP